MGMVRQVLANLNFRDQTIAVCLLSTSQDTVDLFKLNVGFVKRCVKAKLKRFPWRGTRVKTGEKFRTFFGVEASEMLVKYVEQERANAKDDEPLFVMGRTYEYERANPKTKRKEQIVVGGCMTESVIALNLREAQKKMGIVQDKLASPFRPKRFRHLFRSGCSASRIDVGFIHVFMGHTSDVSSGYLEKPLAMLEAQFARVEPYITVFRGETQETIEEVNRQLKEALDDLGNFKSQLLTRDEMVFTLQSDLRETQKTLDKLPQMIDDAIENYLRAVGWDGKIREAERLIATIKARVK